MIGNMLQRKIRSDGSEEVVACEEPVQGSLCEVLMRIIFFIPGVQTSLSALGTLIIKQYRRVIYRLYLG